MAKRGNFNNKRRKRVYWNNDTDNWVDDGKEQLSRGPHGPNASAKILDDKVFQEDAELQKELKDEAAEKEAQEQIDEQALAEEERQRQARKAVLDMKYRRYMFKDTQSKKAEKTAETALGRDVSQREFHDELYDDGVSGDEFMHEAMVDYKDELAEKEAIPLKDTDHDGDVDREDEPTPSKAQRRMERYM
jgi:hypothetical protein